MAKTITVAIDDNLYERISKYCIEKGMKKKEFVTKAMEEFLKKEGY
jgi:metal-responsive CopG/Arc/MetJ family transcriptional regulator